jgi:hypothetical protein
MLRAFHAQFCARESAAEIRFDLGGRHRHGRRQ